MGHGAGARRVAGAGLGHTGGSVPPEGLVVHGRRGAARPWMCYGEAEQPRHALGDGFVVLAGCSQPSLPLATQTKDGRQGEGIRLYLGYGVWPAPGHRGWKSEPAANPQGCLHRQQAAADARGRWMWCSSTSLPGEVLGWIGGCWRPEPAGTPPGTRCCSIPACPAPGTAALPAAPGSRGITSSRPLKSASLSLQNKAAGKRVGAPAADASG